jgi:hypothetical protein
MSRASDRKCPTCGGHRWVAGHLRERMGVAFKPRDVKFLTLKLGYPAVAALACGECGFLILEVDPEAVRGILKE